MPELTGRFNSPIPWFYSEGSLAEAGRDSESERERERERYGNWKRPNLQF